MYGQVRSDAVNCGQMQRDAVSADCVIVDCRRRFQLRATVDVDRRRLNFIRVLV